MPWSRNDPVVNTVQEFLDLTGTGVRLEHVERNATAEPMLGRFEPLKGVHSILKHVLSKRNDPGKTVYPVALDGGKHFSRNHTKASLAGLSGYRRG